MCKHKLIFSERNLDFSAIRQVASILKQFSDGTFAARCTVLAYSITYFGTMALDILTDFFFSGLRLSFFKLLPSQYCCHKNYRILQIRELNE